MVDLIVVNKADGPLVPVANLAASEYASALRFIEPKHNFWTPQVVTCSAREKKKIEEVWKLIKEFWDRAEVIQFILFSLC